MTRPVALKTLKPGSTIGILGGGQLGRMLALAAARLGLSCHIYAPEADSPAFAVAATHTIAAYDNADALAAFAKSVDVVTFEFENVPAAALDQLATLVPVAPGAGALRVAQDRIAEKNLAQRLGAMTASFRPVQTLADLDTALKDLGTPALLKTVRFGYDGKGQTRINAPQEAAEALASLKGAPAILERLVDFDMEVSVIAARDQDGNFAAFDGVQNQHSHQILHTSTVPASLDSDLAAEALFITRRIAEALDYVGVLAVEFFIAGDMVYVNEIAPRVHNSGHWTLEACVISQFEQHIRAIAGWPLGDGQRHSDAEMTNLLGDDARDWQALAARPATALHLYGKDEIRQGRKMGHITRISPRQA